MAQDGTDVSQAQLTSRRLGRRAALRAAVAAGSMLALAPFGVAPAAAQGNRIRWDVSPGSAFSVNDLRMAMRGTGTFMPGAPRDVSGGGTFAVSDARGTPIFDGDFRATELLYWQQEEAPGNGDSRSGLAVLRVAYPGGVEGILTISCYLPGSNRGVFEGITATHTSIAFYDAEPGNTLFSVVSAR